ncbi:ATP-binding protein [Coleofasciculus sp. FACHB-129]|uniref:ATP-dependent nuclease n=1 Tax=Cyanophyceae TaxID=3028117 RepID=UPI001684B4B3|nr:ATP-binding protein [Coleofasciculus sp. FACHB-129]MBD1897448.1 AAA family ATPase [Coleofasciculus sp. FACHB-129]
MYLSEVQIFNYKSFVKSEPLEFLPGINIIVGQNNSGKTALLEALALNFIDVPHRSIKTLPTPFSQINYVSTVQVRLKIEKTEFCSIIDNHLLPLSIPKASDDENLSFDATTHRFRQWLFEPSPVEVSLLIPSINARLSHVDNPLNDINFGYQPKPPNNEGRYSSIDIKRTKDDSFGSYGQSYCEIERHSGVKLFNLFRSRIYRFYAERLNVGLCNFGKESKLQPNASNLAEVLNVLLSRNPARWERFNQLVSVIFPDIKRISIEPKQANQLEIMVWHIDHNTEREDLAFPLSSCGTGIGQVLAILYVVLTSSQEPQTIIIDEPQSFLHPGAAKKLIEIIKEFPEHQYFIATHSPMIIAAANPSTIVKLRYVDCETKTSVMNSEDVEEQRSLLDEVGVRLSDVFGADNILWVEGPTEEKCFPMILQKLAKMPLRGTQILAIKNTGDLEGKRARIIFDIYDKLSGGKSLSPPAIGFVLDSEGKPEKDMEGLAKRSQNPVKFLPRRMYENYLLHAEAIAAVINQYDKSRKEPLTSIEVQEWLDKTKQEGLYLPRGVSWETLPDEQWFSKVDGANLLKDLFAELCDTRLEFSKTTHSPKLTEWLIEHDPNSLSELSKLLQEIFDSK